MDTTTDTPLRFEPPAPRRGLGIPLAPLIDIVFLLNCFFMMATEMVRDQIDPRVELAAMKSPEAGAEAPAELIANLCPDGSLTINGAEVPVHGLAPLVGSQLARAENAGRPLRVVIRADRRQQFARLDEVLQACRTAGLQQVVLRAREGESP